MSIELLFSTSHPFPTPAPQKKKKGQQNVIYHRNTAQITTVVSVLPLRRASHPKFRHVVTGKTPSHVTSFVVGCYFCKAVGKTDCFTQRWHGAKAVCDTPHFSGGKVCLGRVVSVWPALSQSGLFSQLRCHGGQRPNSYWSGPRSGVAKVLLRAGAGTIPYPGLTGEWWWNSLESRLSWCLVVNQVELTNRLAKHAWVSLVDHSGPLWKFTPAALLCLHHLGYVNTRW